MFACRYAAAVGVALREVRRVLVCRRIPVETGPSRGNRGGSCDEWETEPGEGGGVALLAGSLEDGEARCERPSGVLPGRASARHLQPGDEAEMGIGRHHGTARAQEAGSDEEIWNRQDDAPSSSRQARCAAAVKSTASRGLSVISSNNRSIQFFLRRSMMPRSTSKRMSPQVRRIRLRCDLEAEMRRPAPSRAGRCRPTNRRKAVRSVNARQCFGGRAHRRQDPSLRRVPRFRERTRPPLFWSGSRSAS